MIHHPARRHMLVWDENARLRRSHLWRIGAYICEQDIDGSWDVLSASEVAALTKLPPPVGWPDEAVERWVGMIERTISVGVFAYGPEGEA